MNKDERITYEEFMIMFRNAPRMAYMLYEKAEDEIDKYKNVIDKIKEKIELDLKDGRPKDHLWLMGYYDACKDINKLLEEVE